MPGDVALTPPVMAAIRIDGTPAPERLRSLRRSFDQPTGQARRRRPLSALADDPLAIVWHPAKGPQGHGVVRPWQSILSSNGLTVQLEPGFRRTTLARGSADF